MHDISASFEVCFTLRIRAVAANKRVMMHCQIISRLLYRINPSPFPLLVLSLFGSCALFLFLPSRRTGVDACPQFFLPVLLAEMSVLMAYDEEESISGEETNGDAANVSTKPDDLKKED